MKIELKDLLSTMNSRFSGPESCKIQDMISGKIDFDSDEIKGYLSRLKDFGGTNGYNTKQVDRQDAEMYLNKFTEFMNKK